MSMASALESYSGYINAGGRGTRLSDIIGPSELTGVSKALIDIPSGSIVDYQIDRMLHSGLEQVVIGVGDHYHVAESINDRWGKDSRVEPVTVEVQLGTAGDLVQAISTVAFRPNIIIANVDTILDIAINELAAQQNDTPADLTLAVTHRKGVPNQGAIYIDNDGRIIQSSEIKDLPSTNLTPKYTASSAGMIALSGEVVSNRPWLADRPSSLYTDLMADVLKKGVVYAFDNGRKPFLDIGTPRNYEIFQRLLALAIRLEDKQEAA